MVQITIQIDGDKVTVNQSAAPTKVEKNKKFFIIMGFFEEQSWIEFVSDDYITAANKLRCLRYNSCNDNSCSYSLLIQYEDERILPCNGTDWDIDR